uniref:Uncharacterized protein n=1 Tax=Anguilla anguilla TaxID=7936 RepID=A0A0E9Q7C3_ANGAN
MLPVLYQTQNQIRFTLQCKDV